MKQKSEELIQFLKANPDIFSFLKKGDLVEGTIIEKSPRSIFINLGKYGTGVIYRGELINARGATRDKEEGDKIQAKVLEIDNNDGYVELSISKAERQKNWEEIEILDEKEEIIEALIVDANKGGLITEVEGVQAFLPASQLSSENYPDVENNDKEKIEEELKKMIGEKIKVRIIDANISDNKLIVSEKAAMEESARELAKNYEVGQEVEGIVSGVADFGVFIKFTDNPDVEGLVHISELAHKTIDNPKELVSIDDAIKAKIIDIKDGKISLSIKALQEDPWELADKKYKEGDEVKGKAYNLNQFGAIIELDEGLQGQVHITDFGGVEEMKKVIEKGEDYKFEVKEVKAEDKRIVLKLKK
ncbi:MAG: S1 RNA-binding domain-containing protein [Candidatus Paceibacterota bacterium]